MEHGEEIARHRLEADNAFVNTPVRSDPRPPFGGIKGSGYGRAMVGLRSGYGLEMSAPGIREFTKVRTVLVA